MEMDAQRVRDGVDVAIEDPAGPVAAEQLTSTPYNNNNRRAPGQGEAQAHARHWPDALHAQPSPQGEERLPGGHRRQEAGAQVSELRIASSKEA